MQSTILVYTELIIQFIWVLYHVAWLDDTSLETYCWVLYCDLIGHCQQKCYPIPGLLYRGSQIG